MNLSMRGTMDYYDKTALEWAKRGYAEDGELICLRDFLHMLPERARVLDLCCGAGYECRRMKKLGCEVVGIDFSGESLKIAREHNPDVSFYQADLRGDYSRIGKVDGIIVIAGLIHIETADLRLAFEQMAKVLPTGGLALLSIREGIGKMRDRSLAVIDGEQYDRNFIAHTLAELEAAADGIFVFECALKSDRAVWKNYVFRKITCG